MISTISGEIIGIGADNLTIDIHGIGFDVAVPKALTSEFHLGQRISLFTHLIVREDLLALYGFPTSEERAYFLLLLGVEGIGPRLALAVISTLSMDAIRRAVFSEQPEVFTRVPGIGKKTAQKIIIHLQGRIKTDQDYEPIRRFDDVDSQVFEALVELGYSVVEAQSAIQALPSDSPNQVEDRLRTALQFLSR